MKHVIRTGLARFTLTAGAIAVIALCSKYITERKEAMQRYILEVDLNRVVEPRRRDLGLARLFGGPQEASLEDVQEALALAQNDPGVVAVLGRCTPGTALELKLAGVQELASSIYQFQAVSKKPAWAHTTTITSALQCLALAPFSQVLLQPSSFLYAPPPTTGSVFFKNFLDKVGVDALVEKRKEYKNFPNQFTNQTFTEPHKDALSCVEQALDAQTVAGINWFRPAAQKYSELRKKVILVGKEIANTGLVDGFCFPNQIEYNLETQMLECRDLGVPPLPSTAPPITSIFEGLRATADKRVRVVRIGVVDYLEKRRRERKKRTKDAEIAIINATGSIAAFGAVPPQTLKSVFETARRTKTVRAVVVRISSPGGGVDESAEIWSEIIKTKATGKPVIVSMGDVAASGGYMIAAAADAIVAQPGTITGSIGVFVIKPVITSLLRKIGANVNYISLDGSEKVLEMTAPNDKKEIEGENQSEDNAAGLTFSLVRDWNNADHKIMTKLLDHMYDSFVHIVAQGRNMPVDQVEAVAKGRIWTGEQALHIGLVDKLGGIEDAVQIARKKIGIPDARTFPLNKRPERLSDLLNETAESSKLFTELRNAWLGVKTVTSSNPSEKIQFKSDEL